MLKRVCDRCEKVIDHDEFWFEMKCNRMDDSSVYCGAGIYEFCENCFNEFKSTIRK